MECGASGLKCKLCHIETVNTNKPIICCLVVLYCNNDLWLTGTQWICCWQTVLMVRKEVEGDLLNSNSLYRIDGELPSLFYLINLTLLRHCYKRISWEEKLHNIDLTVETSIIDCRGFCGRNKVPVIKASVNNVCTSWEWKYKYIPLLDSVKKMIVEFIFYLYLSSITFPPDQK